LFTPSCFRSCFSFPLYITAVIACILLTCPQAGAVSIEDLAGTDIYITGDGSTVFYGGGYSYSVQKDGATSTMAASVMDTSVDGSYILAKQSNGYYYLYSGSDDSTPLLLTSATTDRLYGMSPDGKAVIGSYLNGPASNAILWLTEDYSNWEEVTFASSGSPSDVSNVNADGKRVIPVLSYGTGNIYYVDESTHAVTAGANLESGSGIVSRMSINANGTLVAGTVSTNNVARASIWNTSSGALTSLYQGTATASEVLGMNTSGSVLVGYGTFDSTNQALYWTGSGTSYTMHNLLETLEEEDVDMTGWALSEATGASDDGTYIVGTGTLSGSDVVFIANVPAGGLSTTEALYQSLGTMGQVGPAVTGMGQLSMSRLGGVAGGQGMHFAVSNPVVPSAATGRETGLSSGDEMPGRLDLWVVGSVGTNIELDGDDLGLHGGIGLTWERGEWRVGGGLFGDSRDLDTSYHGNQDIQAVGPGAFVAYSPEGTGLEFRISGLWQTVDLDLRRGYANGAGYATSKGSTNADVFGLSGRVQWTRAVTDQLALTPFAEYTWQTTHIDGYSESGGPFPASFDSRDETSNSLRTGLRADAALLDKVATWAWIAWDHRFEDKSSGLGGTALGLGSFSYAGSRVDQDWADTGVGASWDVTERLSANTSLGFALGCDDDTMSDLNVTLGFSYQLW
jgi:uncharacterized protein YhjY with autotransporter beta-barrel domain